MKGLKVNKNTKRVNFYFHPHLYIPYTTRYGLSSLAKKLRERKGTAKLKFGRLPNVSLDD